MRASIDCKKLKKKLPFISDWQCQHQPISKIASQQQQVFLALKTRLAGSVFTVQINYLVAPKVLFEDPLTMIIILVMFRSRVV